MPDGVCVAAVQPPFPEGKAGHQRMVEAGIRLAGDAAKAGAKVICLPEYFGVFGLPENAVYPGPDRDGVLKELAVLARSHGAAILYPTLEPDEAERFNTTWLVDPKGDLAGKYRKVHLTRTEREAKGLSSGDDFPVFRIGDLVFGVMVCYDVYFPESARILALKGARAVFFPSLQRNATESLLALQVRSRAVDNCVYVVRSSYGYPASKSWNPGMMVGLSCIVDWDGEILANLGHNEGFLTAVIPQQPRPRKTSFDGPEDDPRDFLFEDRRPEAYQALCQRRAKAAGDESHPPTKPKGT